jgi:hypothetical protein
MDITGDITGNLSGSVGSLTGHTVQTGDTFALANGATGFVAIDTVVDSLLAYWNVFILTSGTIGATGNDTTHLHLTGLPYGDNELNDYILVIYDNSATEYHSVWITDWVDATDLATVETMAFTPQNSVDPYWIFALKKHPDVSTILADTAAMDTAAEMKTLVWASVLSDLGAGAPSATPSVFDAVNWLYSLAINKLVTNGTNSEVEYYNNAGTKIAESDISDDGTDFTRSKIGVID